MKRLVSILLAISIASGCAVVVKGSPLSNPELAGNGHMYLSTGGSPQPYKIIGFVQVRSYGVEVAGLADIGDHAIDSALKGSLVEAAHEMGGDAVIHIDVLDENPSTPAERAQAAVDSATSLATGGGEVETKNRWVRVTGEVIKFLPE